MHPVRRFRSRRQAIRKSEQQFRAIKGIRNTCTARASVFDLHGCVQAPIFDNQFLRTFIPLVIGFGRLAILFPKERSSGNFVPPTGVAFGIEIGLRFARSTYSGTKHRAHERFLVFGTNKYGRAKNRVESKVAICANLQDSGNANHAHGFFVANFLPGENNNERRTNVTENVAAKRDPPLFCRVWLMPLTSSFLVFVIQVFNIALLIILLILSPRHRRDTSHNSSTNDIACFQRPEPSHRRFYSWTCSHAYVDECLDTPNFLRLQCHTMTQLTCVGAPFQMQQTVEFQSFVQYWRYLDFSTFYLLADDNLFGFCRPCLLRYDPTYQTMEWMVETSSTTLFSHFDKATMRFVCVASAPYTSSYWHVIDCYVDKQLGHSLPTLDLSIFQQFRGEFELFLNTHQQHFAQFDRDAVHMSALVQHRRYADYFLPFDPNVQQWFCDKRAQGIEAAALYDEWQNGDKTLSSRSDTLATWTMMHPHLALLRRCLPQDNKALSSFDDS